MSAAARNITPVPLELGGKSPVVVFADADLEQAAGWAMMAAFVNMGEVCVAGSRLPVHKSVYDEVVARVAEQASFLPTGDAPDPDKLPGPLITAAPADRVPGSGPRPSAQTGRPRCRKKMGMWVSSSGV